MHEVGKVTMTWNADKLLGRVVEACNKGLYAAAMVGRDKAKELVSTPGNGSPSAPGSPPHVGESAQLSGNINAVNAAYLGRPLSAAYGTWVPHGGYQERGAIIRPKSGKALPVPLNEPARYMLSHMHGQSLRTKKLIPIKKNGKRLLVEKTPTGRVKKNGAVFRLVTVVVLPKRPWLIPSLEQSKDAMVAAFKRTTQEALAL